MIDTDGRAFGVSTFESDGNHYALVADYDKGLKIINITDPKNLTQRGSIDTDGFAYEVSFFENDDNQYALIADELKGLKIINISDP